MASMDLDTIIRDLNKRFAAPLPEFYKRRIISGMTRIESLRTSWMTFRWIM